MRVVEENNELLLKLISDILDLEDQAGTFEFTMAGWTSTACARRRAFAQSQGQGQTVELIFEHDAQCCVVGDKNRLIQVITNFINNAVKFTDEGPLRWATARGRRPFMSKTPDRASPKSIGRAFDRFVKLNSFAQAPDWGFRSEEHRRADGRPYRSNRRWARLRFWFTIPAVTCDAPEKKNAAPHRVRRRHCMATDGCRGCSWPRIPTAITCCR